MERKGKWKEKEGYKIKLWPNSKLKAKEPEKTKLFLLEIILPVKLQNNKFGKKGIELYCCELTYKDIYSWIDLFCKKKNVDLALNKKTFSI